ncbi:DUF3889 domain-containing protein [Peribacillus glennii]|uniref:DUF3889 domain-containing protein n=1 Tax=Peribacillus glennii TaxID=2303991 RepID=A0A372L9T5_9BACI|nr:DUF3889 domain-containing protein [Peribacillus glennii]RFU62021.1 DUF3889 domain-containing protein [Peribacillus glennii]
MKKLLGILFAVVFLCQSGIVSAQQPDYEKYGKIAISVVQGDYPGESVTDYQYMGRKNLGNGQVEDSFLFTVKENGKTVKPLVKVRHSVTNNKLLNLSVEEMSGQTQP